MSIDDQDSDDDIREQAARWVVRLNEGDLNEIEREELQHWLLADLRHLQEFRAHNAIVSMAAELPLDAHARIVGREANKDETDEATSRRWYAPFSTAAANRKGRLVAFAAAAAVAVVALTGWLFVQNTQPQSYVTGTGETRTVNFEDGSIAYLNAKTRLQWQDDEHERRVVLLAGEALFEVMHDAGRPFRVVLENSEIQVLGTRFNVYQKQSGDVIVTVLEGRVRVQDRAGKMQEITASGDARPGWKRELGPNQQIVYRNTGFVRDVRTTDAHDAVKWRDGILEMKAGTLAEVVEELTRYTDHPVFISDPRLAGLQIGGAFNIRDVRAALTRIESIAPVAVTENGSTFTLDYRSQEREENR